MTSDDHREPDQPPTAETAAARPAGGGGGGTYGATLGSRLDDVLHDMDAAQAADTGGIANNPTRILSSGETGGIWTDTDTNRANFELSSTTSETPWEDQRIEESVRIDELRRCVEERFRREEGDTPSP